VGVLSADRDLRAFGSQGEQRLAVLALLLGEAELLEEQRGVRPLLLLDDVLSELDPERRRILTERLRVSGQALVTSASRNAFPGDPAQTLEVSQEGTSSVRTV
jgi:DNA replication and repair protein RecF